MIVFLFCSFLTIFAAILATFLSDIRKAVLALWITGLGAGGLFLSVGAELLAVVQWIVSTLVAISFIFYAVMFGEYGMPDLRPKPKRYTSLGVSVLLGAAFAWVIWLGAHQLPGATLIEPILPENTTAQSMLALGKSIAEEHLLSLEILGLTLFLVIVGSGVIARPEGSEQ